MPMKLLTFDDIQALHKKYAPNEEALASVLEHCQIVRDIALQIAEGLDSVDRDLLEVGALLHDIGVYRLYHDGEIDWPRYIMHGFLGYELLQKEGLDEAVCRFALLHTGVGLSKDDPEIQSVGMPVRDYIPETDEEKIVMYADKFHTKIVPPTFNSVTWYTEYLRSKFGEAKAQRFIAFVQQFGEPDLKPLIAKYGQGIR
jgi:uncharacterized protein